MHLLFELWLNRCCSVRPAGMPGVRACTVHITSVLGACLAFSRLCKMHACSPGRGDISEVRTQTCADIMHTGAACRRTPSRCRLSLRSLCHWMGSEHIVQSGPSTPPPSVSQAIWAIPCVVGVSSVCHHVGLMFRIYQTDTEVGDSKLCWVSIIPEVAGELLQVIPVHFSRLHRLRRAGRGYRELCSL